MTEQSHTISFLVENQFGVLMRVAGLLSARGFNIESLTVNATDDATVSRMTIVVRADAMKLEQVKRQLNRLIDVIEVEELRPGNFIDRELLLAAVDLNEASIAGIDGVAGKYGARIIEKNAEAVLLEAAGDSARMDALVNELRTFGIKQLARTGRVALKHV